jgi:hypothetical protein
MSKTCSFETLVLLYYNTRRHIPDDRNFKSQQFSPCYSDRLCGPPGLLSNWCRAFFPEVFVGIFTRFIHSYFTERWWQHLTWRLMVEQLARTITINLSHDSRRSSQNSNPKRLEDKLKALQFESSSSFTRGTAVDAGVKLITTVHFTYLETCRVRKQEKMRGGGGPGKRLMPALWQEMLAKSSSHNIFDTSTRCWA